MAYLENFKLLNLVFNQINCRMKNLILSSLFLLAANTVMAQSLFNYEETEVMTFMEGKEFYNSGYGLTISYGYISRYNTYGIISTNREGARFYFINCSINAYANYADISGMSLADGSNFGFRVFSNRLVVGYGESEQVTFYLTD